MDVIRPLESLLSDLRYGARQLRVNPGFATVAILSLALGIGANTAIFQMIDALRLRSLPVERPSELATIDTRPGEALATMLERHFRHLPVVDNAGKLLGMLSIRNLLEQRIDDLSHELDALEQYVTNDGPGG